MTETSASGPLVAARRSRFREVFQPSRIVIGLFATSNESGVNPITLCYVMHSSHKPRTMTVAIEKANASCDLATGSSEFVLAVPGEDLVDEALAFGTLSLRDCPDKVAEVGLELGRSQEVRLPSVNRALGNIELETRSAVNVEDHMLVTGLVKAHSLNPRAEGPPLVSIGPQLGGYRLLRKSGIHRIAVVDR